MGGPPNCGSDLHVAQLYDCELTAFVCLHKVQTWPVPFTEVSLVCMCR